MNNCNDETSHHWWRQCCADMRANLCFLLHWTKIAPRDLHIRKHTALFDQRTEVQQKNFTFHCQIYFYKCSIEDKQCDIDFTMKQNWKYIRSGITMNYVTISFKIMCHTMYKMKCWFGLVPNKSAKTNTSVNIHMIEENPLM